MNNNRNQTDNQGGRPAGITEKDLKIGEYLDKGLTVTDTAKLVGLSRTRTSLIKNRKLNKYKLTSPSLLRKSVKVTHKILDGFINDDMQLDGKTPSIRPSDVLRIVEMQQDRIDPVLKFDPSPTGQSISFTQVNINTQFINNDEPVKSAPEIDFTPVLPIEVGEDRDKQGIADNDSE